MISKKLFSIKTIFSVIFIIVSIILFIFISSKNELIAKSAGPSYSLRYIDGRTSFQELSYILYMPANADATTPIVLFLHGDADVGETYSQAVNRYQFLRCLKNGTWQPNFIMIMPIARKSGNWANEKANVLNILKEVSVVFGGDLNKTYIAGASAGADGITPIAQSFDFKGAIYMAGHLNGKKGKMSAQTVMSLWQNKIVLYYRDNLQKRGGYGYDANFIQTCYTIAPGLNTTFYMVDLNWNHDYGLVDATFLPTNFKDDYGRPCFNALKHFGLQ